MKCTAANMAKASFVTTGIVSGVTNMFEVFQDKKELADALHDVGAVAVIVLLWKKDKKRMTEEAEERYKAGKEEAADIIRMTIDKIQDDKSKLSDMAEKDLMVETMLALGPMLCWFTVLYEVMEGDC